MNVLLVARNVFRRLRHDLLTVFMIGTIPLIFIRLFGYTFSGSPTDVRVIVVDHDRGTITLNTREFGTVIVEKSPSAELAAGFGEKVFHIRRIDAAVTTEKELKEEKVWAVIVIQPGLSQEVIDRVLQIKGKMPSTYQEQTIHLLSGSS